MAIFGTLNTLSRQADASKFGKAIDFLRSSDLAAIFDSLAPGEKKTVRIDGDDVFAIFQQYETKPLSEGRLEAHRRFIDLQYIFSGAEQIGYADLADINGPADYDSSADIFFTTAVRSSLVTLAAGQGAIFTPDDLHAPCLSPSATPVHVRKIVIKIKA